jgi:hypothetical protein
VKKQIGSGEHPGKEKAPWNGKQSDANEQDEDVDQWQRRGNVAAAKNSPNKHPAMNAQDADSNRRNRNAEYPSQSVHSSSESFMARA